MANVMRVTVVMYTCEVNLVKKLVVNRLNYITRIISQKSQVAPVGYIYCIY